MEVAPMKQERQYNENIRLLKDVTKADPRQVEKGLAKDEYFVLMVTDNPDHNKVNFWDRDKGYLGLERNSNNRVYISRKLNNRLSAFRGVTFLARVTDPTICYELTY